MIHFQKHNSLKFPSVFWTLLAWWCSFVSAQGQNLTGVFLPQTVLPSQISTSCLPVRLPRASGAASSWFVAFHRTTELLFWIISHAYIQNSLCSSIMKVTFQMREFLAKIWSFTCVESICEKKDILPKDIFLNRYLNPVT